jgi:hypothetical protein
MLIFILVCEEMILVEYLSGERQMKRFLKRLELQGKLSFVIEK